MEIKLIIVGKGWMKLVRRLEGDVEREIQYKIVRKTHLLCEVALIFQSIKLIDACQYTFEVIFSGQTDKCISTT